MSFSFGPSAAAPPAAGGLFGSTGTSSAPSFGSTGGLFGQQPQSTGGSSLFGQPASQPSFSGFAPQPPAGGSSFAFAPAPASFGQSFGTTGGGLFGSSFGQPQQQPQQQQPGTGAFGGGAFGFQQQAPQQQQPGGLFGGGALGTTTTQPPLWQQQQLLQQQQLQQQMLAVRETTTYEQLPPRGHLICKETVDAVQKHLDDQRRIAEQLRNAANVGDSAKRLSARVKAVRQVLSRAENEQRLARAASAELLDHAKSLKNEGDVLAAKASSPADTVELPPPVLWSHQQRCENRLRAYAAEIERITLLLSHAGKQAPTKGGALTMEGALAPQSVFDQVLPQRQQQQPRGVLRLTGASFPSSLEEKRRASSLVDPRQQQQQQEGRSFPLALTQQQQQLPSGSSSSSVFLKAAPMFEPPSHQYHAVKETPEERLKRLLVAQNDAFMRVAAVISDSHKRVEDLRAEFSRKRDGDVFTAQDREDQAERKEIDNQIRAEQHQLQQPTTAMQQHHQLLGGGGTSSSGLFPAGTNGTTTITTPGGGLFGQQQPGTGLFSVAPGASSTTFGGAFSPTTPSQPTLLSSTTSRKSSGTRRGSTRKGK